MALFDQILGAVNNPNQQGSPDQLSSILGAVQQFSAGQGVEASSMQGAVSTVGSYVRSALQEKRTTEGDASVQSMVNQFAGTTPNPSAVQALFTPQQQQQIAQVIAQKTGVDPGMAQMLLAAAVPIVLKLLSTGNSSSPTQTPNTPDGNNSVLSTFLDADGDGDVDMADTLSMAGRFLQNR